MRDEVTGHVQANEPQEGLCLLCHNRHWLVRMSEDVRACGQFIEPFDTNTDRDIICGNYTVVCGEGWFKVCKVSPALL